MRKFFELVSDTRTIAAVVITCMAVVAITAGWTLQQQRKALLRANAALQANAEPQRLPQSSCDDAQRNLDTLSLLLCKGTADLGVQMDSDEFIIGRFFSALRLSQLPYIKLEELRPAQKDMLTNAFVAAIQKPCDREAVVNAFMPVMRLCSQLPHDQAHALGRTVEKWQGHGGRSAELMRALETSQAVFENSRQQMWMESRLLDNPKVAESEALAPVLGQLQSADPEVRDQGVVAARQQFPSLFPHKEK